MKKNNYDEYINKKYNRLTVNSYEIIKGRVYFNCTCECGNNKKSLYSNVVTGKTKSCGCLFIEKVKQSNTKRNSYNLSGEYGIGYTFKNEEFYFDLEDYDKIKDYCWSTRHGYLRARNPLTNKDIIMHRLIMDVLDDKNVVVDHIKHNKLDNRKSQLRICTNTENSRNKEKVSCNTSGYTGITYNKKRNCWNSQITVNKKSIHLGTFYNLDDAILARRNAENKYFGEFSYHSSMNNN